MALRGAVARRYAQAIFDIAKENKTLDLWLADLEALRMVFGNDVAVQVLGNPGLKATDQKSEIDKRLTQLKVHPLAANMLRMLVDRQRLVLLPKILESFKQLYNREKGIVIAYVTSAVPLDEGRKKQVVSELSQMTGKTIDLQTHHDPAILGGLITRIGDELIDASVATRLAALGERLS